MEKLNAIEKEKMAEAKVMTEALKQKAMQESREMKIETFSTKEIMDLTLVNHPQGYDSEYSSLLIQELDKNLVNAEFIETSMNVENVKGEIQVTEGETSYGGGGSYGDGYGVTEGHSSSFQYWEADVIDLDRATEGDWLSWKDYSGYDEEVVDKSDPDFDSLPEFLFVKQAKDWKAYELL